MFLSFTSKDPSSSFEELGGFTVGHFHAEEEESQSCGVPGFFCRKKKIYFTPTLDLLFHKLQKKKYALIFRVFFTKKALALNNREHLEKKMEECGKPDVQEFHPCSRT